MGLLAGQCLVAGCSFGKRMFAISSVLGYRSRRTRPGRTSRVCWVLVRLQVQPTRWGNTTLRTCWLSSAILTVAESTHNQSSTRWKLPQKRRIPRQHLCLHQVSFAQVSRLCCSTSELSGRLERHALLPSVLNEKNLCRLFVCCDHVTVLGITSMTEFSSQCREISCYWFWQSFGKGTCFLTKGGWGGQFYIAFGWN